MKKFPNGSATIELMIALAVLATMLATAAAVSYGNFAMTMDSQEYQKRLYEVSSNLEWGRAELTKDLFSTVTPPSGVTYETIDDCSRRVISTKTWTAGPRSQYITQVTKVVDPEAVQHIPTCFLTTPSPGWACPLLGSNATITPTVSPTGMDIIGATVAPNKRYGYVTSTTTSSSDRPAFLIYDVTNADSAVTISPAVSPIERKKNEGFNDVVAIWADNGSTAYAYLASEDPAKQLEIVDIKTTSGTYNTIIAGGTLTLPSNSKEALSVAYIERTISAVDKKVLFIGTENNTSGGEFFAIDVTTPGAPAVIGSAVEIGADVNDIVLTVDNYAYLATGSNTGELIAIDLTSSDLSVMTPTFIDLTPSQPGLALWKVGDRLYFGRSDQPGNDSNHDFLIFNIATRLSPSPITGENLEADVNALVVVENLAFLSTDDSIGEMKVRQGMLTDDICVYSNNDLSNKSAALDFEGDRVYALSVGGSVDLQVYRPNPSTCTVPPPACS